MTSLFDQFDRWVHVEGARLPALERNLVRYRINQIILFLFKVENLKVHLNGLYFDGENNGASNKKPHHLNDDKWEKIPSWRKALEQLFDRNLLSRKAIREFVKLVTYRDTIAHDLSPLFGDIGRSRVNREMMKFSFKGQKRFRYDYLGSLTACETKIYQATDQVTHATLHLDPIMFESVEKFIDEELRRLKPKIDSLFEKRKIREKRMRAEIFEDSESWDWHGEFYPRHPDYKFKNGRLTSKGEKAIHFLFEQGKSDLAIAYLMSLSVQSVKKRRKNGS